MAGTMNFFRAQDEARGRTTKLVVLLVLAILALAGSLYVLAVLGKGELLEHGELDWFQGDLFCLTSGLALVVILGGSLVRIAELSKGGGAIAERLGGRLVSGVTKDPAERRYLNVVQEMALAAGLPVPLCFVLDDESINAFAAGNSPQDAAVGVTRGALRHLTRDELQGVIAHEFSHIGNGDMKLNLRIIGAIAGLTALAQLGYIFFRLAGSVRGKNSAPIALAMILTGVVVLLIGSGGILFGKIIQAAVSREREYLADASAVQFTRNPLGLGSALKKIAGFAGARRDASEAELEAQHLFFASSGGFLESLFSTHPPIDERIRRIDPAFDGHIPDVKPVAVSADDASPVSRAAPIAMAVPPLPAAAPRAVPTDHRIQDSVGFRGVIPSDLRSASDDPVSAMGLVLGLLLRRDPALRAAQLAKARGLAGGEVVREAERCEPLLRALPAGSRVPLLDLSMPALRQLSAEQEGLFRLAITQVGYQAEDGLIVLLIQASMRRYLSREKDPPSRPGDMAAACALVLTAVVRTSGESAEAQARAYRLGAAVLGLPGLDATLLPAGQVDLQKVDEALAVIAGQSVHDRRKFVRACGAAMLHDDQAEPAEVEIVRAVGDSLGISFATGLKA